MISAQQNVHSNNSLLLGSLLETLYQCVTAITNTLKQNTNSGHIHGVNSICLMRSFRRNCHLLRLNKNFSLDVSPENVGGILKSLKSIMVDGGHFEN